MADDLIRERTPMACKEFAYFRCDEGEVIHDRLDGTVELGDQVVSLRGPPTGQLFRLTLTRHLTGQRERGTVPKPTSSAPSIVAIDGITPAADSAVRAQLDAGRAGHSSPRTCCASVRPSSHGVPAFLIDDSGLAPVPPSMARDLNLSA